MSTAAEFMRDNTNGGLVVKATTLKNGSIRYTMEEGHSYLITLDDIDILNRYSFQPRFKKRKN